MPICDLLSLKRMLAKAKQLGMPLLFPRFKYCALADRKEAPFRGLKVGRPSSSLKLVVQLC